jgi:tRNA nucleotidyltransferase (CCA-adding enzyme)
VRPLEPVSLRCEAHDDELLFAEWLNALIYEVATRRMLFSRFSVRIDNSA